MGFYEDHRIKRKNALYNFPDEETNQEACVLLKEYDDAGMGKLAQYDTLKYEIREAHLNSHWASVLKTALIMLMNRN